MSLLTEICHYTNEAFILFKLLCNNDIIRRQVARLQLIRYQAFYYHPVVVNLKVTYICLYHDTISVLYYRLDVTSLFVIMLLPGYLKQIFKP